MTSRTEPGLGIAPLTGKLAAVCLLYLCVAFAQSGSSPAPAPAQSSAPQQPPPPITDSVTAADKNPAEMTSHEVQAAFKVNVRLVLVRTVVRDAQGQAIGTFHKDHFQLFDNGKPQLITHFAVEQPASPVRKPQGPKPQAGEISPAIPPLAPDRFVIYLFDDVHLETKYLLPARNAAERHLATLRPTDRAAIFTTSGQNNLDFTEDRAKLHDALMRLQPRSILNTGVTQCPYMTHYIADQIVNMRDEQALSMVAQDLATCELVPGQTVALALAEAAARQALDVGDAESRLVAETLKNAVRRISATPGQRTVVLISPGFLTPQLEDQVTEIIERAVRSNIIISVLDARGLYTIDAAGDISRPGVPNPVLLQQEFLYESQSEIANQMVLGEIADGTGGTYFHNNNDLEEGFRRVAAAPEYYYVLGFSPQNLKLDGHYHKLKVTLKDPQKFTLQARRGYYAPKHVADPAEQDKQEIEEALFSQDEMHDIPIELHTQFFKSSDDRAKLTVVARVDVKGLHFRKVDGRNRDDLTIVSALFNRNGDYIQGSKKILEMRLKDETLEHKLGSGITMRTSFDVKPGGYLVRLVVRDA
ncbi:MAG: VWA domain-containing protein, partial [Terriglobales bacterium]